RCPARSSGWRLCVLHVPACARFFAAGPCPKKSVRAFSLRAVPAALVDQLGGGACCKTADAGIALRSRDWSVACRPFCHDCCLGCTIPVDRSRGEGSARREVRTSTDWRHGRDVFRRLLGRYGPIWPLLLPVAFGSLPRTSL